MVSLANFPDEILAEILNTNAASDRAIQLWLCGDSRLTTRLERAGCRSFRTRPGMIRARWPAALARLKGLTVLEFKAHSIFGVDTEVVLEEVLKLPPTLLELTLHFEGAAKLPLLDAPSSAAPSSATSSRNAFGNHFSDLRLLSLGGLPGQRSASLVYDRSFALLPRNLLSLRWDACLVWEETHRSFEALPRGLTSLELFDQSDAWTPQLISTLPTGLTSLSGISEISLPDSIARLPMTLQHGDYAHFKTLSWNSDVASKLPPRTQVLRLNTALNFKSAVSSFPKGLTELALATHSFSVADISLLPRTLLALKEFMLVDDALTNHVKLCTSNGTDCRAFWPPHLTTLDFVVTFSLSSALDLTALPASLTVLEKAFAKNGDKLWNSLALLPPQLTALNIEEPLHMFNQWSSEPFPTNITSLRSQITMFPPKAITLLPPGLRSFIFPAAILHLDAIAPNISSLPPTLEVLHIASFDVKFFQLLPSSLLSLRVARMHGNLAGDVLKSLPSSLETLTLEFFANPFVMEPTAFKHLPSSVTSVNLGKKKPIGMDLLEFMPTTVQYLTKLMSVCTDEVLARLPAYWIVWISRHTRIGLGGRLMKYWPADVSSLIALRGIFAD